MNFPRRQLLSNMREVQYQKLPNKEASVEVWKCGSMEESVEVWKYGSKWKLSHFHTSTLPHSPRLSQTSE